MDGAQLIARVVPTVRLLRQRVASSSGTTSTVWTLSAADEPHLEGLPDTYVGHQTLEVSGFTYGNTVDLDDHVFDSDTGAVGGASGRHRDDLEAVRVSK